MSANGASIMPPSCAGADDQYKAADGACDAHTDIARRGGRPAQSCRWRLRCACRHRAQGRTTSTKLPMAPAMRMPSSCAGADDQHKAADGACDAHAVIVHRGGRPAQSCRWRRRCAVRHRMQGRMRKASAADLPAELRVKAPAHDRDAAADSRCRRRQCWPRLFAIKAKRRVLLSRPRIERQGRASR